MINFESKIELKDGLSVLVNWLDNIEEKVDVK